MCCCCLSQGNFHPICGHRAAHFIFNFAPFLPHFNAAVSLRVYLPLSPHLLPPPSPSLSLSIFNLQGTFDLYNRENFLRISITKFIYISRVSLYYIYRQTDSHTCLRRGRSSGRDFAILFGLSNTTNSSRKLIKQSTHK